MSIKKIKESYSSKIAYLDELYKKKSLELVQCSSFSKEQAIKDEMMKYEVEKRVIKRKITSLVSA